MLGIARRNVKSKRQESVGVDAPHSAVCGEDRGATTDCNGFSESTGKRSSHASRQSWGNGLGRSLCQPRISCVVFLCYLLFAICYFVWSPCDNVGLTELNDDSCL